MTACRICQSTTFQVFNYNVIGHCVQLYECPQCAYVQTEDPYWLEQAYNRAINVCDTGIMMRNQINTRIVTASLRTLGKITGSVVDYAGGYGILVRMLRDIGIDAYWSDPYAHNLLATGFEYDSQNNPISAYLVTAFEALEHFVDPLAEFKRLFSIAPNVLVSTELIPSPTPSVKNWWYYTPETGQHIGFFRMVTLQAIATRHNKHLISDGHSYHLFSERPLSAIRWMFLRKISRFAPSLLTRSLIPLTQADFEKLKRTN